MLIASHGCYLASHEGRHTAPVDEVTSFEPRRDGRPLDSPWPIMVWPSGAAELANAHVILRPAVTGDAAELCTALAHSELWTYIPFPPRSPAEWRERISRSHTQGTLKWTVRDRRGRVVGTTSFLDVAPADARLEIGSTVYTRPVWGTAVNPAAKLLLLEHAFETLRVGRVQLKTDVRNERSQRAIARLGARYEGTLRRYQRRTDGTVRDTVLFAITAEDWPRVRDGLRDRLAAARAD